MVRGVLESLGVLLLRVALIITAISLLSFEIAFAKSKADFWESTKVTSEHLKNFVNSDNCYANENNFLGCIAAVDSLLVTSELRLANKAMAGLSTYGDIAQVLERLQIRKYTSSFADKDKSVTEKWKEASAERSTINTSWKHVYQFTKTKYSRISFEDILTAALAKADSKNQKMNIGYAINAYYSSAVDPHTYWIPVSESKHRMQPSSDSVGIGVYVITKGDHFALSPIEDGPAEKAGVRENDILVSVNGAPVTGFKMADVTKSLAGKKGDTVTVEVQRRQEKVTIQIVRSDYTIKNFSAKLVANPATNLKIGYIKLNSFSEKGICEKFYIAAVNLKKAGAKDLILDLRNNGGGLLNEAICMASLYLDKGSKVLSWVDPESNKELMAQDVGEIKVASRVYELYENRPLIILQNAYSASASEVLAGALGSYDRAIRVGVRSYGKGTIQSPNFDMENIGVIMYKTVARFHFADGSSNQLHGLQADIEADFNPEVTEDEKFALREADSYPNAIAASKAPAKFNAGKIAKVQKCMDGRGVVAAEGAIVADYQRLVALEAAACLDTITEQLPALAQAK